MQEFKFCKEEWKTALGNKAVEDAISKAKSKAEPKEQPI